MRSPRRGCARAAPCIAIVLALSCGGISPSTARANNEEDLFQFMHAVLQMMPQFVDAPNQFGQLNGLLEQMLFMVGHHGHRHGPPPWARGHMGRGMAIAHHAACMGPGGGRFGIGDGGCRDGGFGKGGRIGAGMDFCGREAQGPVGKKDGGDRGRGGNVGQQPGCGPRVQQGMQFVKDGQGKRGMAGGPQLKNVQDAPLQGKAGSGMIGGKAGMGRGPQNFNNILAGQAPKARMKIAQAAPIGNAKFAPIQVAPVPPKNLAQARPAFRPANGANGMAKNQPNAFMQGKGGMGIAKNQPIAFVQGNAPQDMRGMVKPMAFGQGVKGPQAFGGAAKPLNFPRPNQPVVMQGMVRPVGMANNFQGMRGMAKPMAMPQQPQVQRPNLAMQQPKAMPQMNRPQQAPVVMPKGPQAMQAMAKPQPRLMPQFGNANMAMRFSPVAMQRGPTPLTAARGVGGMMGGPMNGPRRR